jgi:hypothetical protein
MTKPRSRSRRKNGGRASSGRPLCRLATGPPVTAVSASAAEIHQGSAAVRPPPNPSEPRSSLRLTRREQTEDAQQPATSQKLINIVAIVLPDAAFAGAGSATITNQADYKHKQNERLRRQSRLTHVAWPRGNRRRFVKPNCLAIGRRPTRPMRGPPPASYGRSSPNHLSC